MADELLEQIGKQIPSLKDSLSKARDAIDFLREVGEDVSTLETDYKTNADRLARWEAALRRRGIKTTSVE